MASRKPQVDISGTEGSAFKLLMRVKNALRDAGASSTVVATFDLEAGGQAIRALSAEDALWQGLYARALETAKTYCTVWCGEKAA